MKVLVLYKSKTGFVKKYAEWIAKELKADIFEASNVRKDIFSSYETVIYGGGLYAVGINGIKTITKNMEKLIGKKVVIFASGASPFKPEVLEEVKNKNFSVEQQKKIAFFYLRGGFDSNKLPIVEKILMKLLNIKIKHKKKKGEELTADERGMLEAYEKPIDFTDIKYIDDIITYVKS